MDDSTKREFKDRLYEQFERAAQALSSADGSNCWICSHRGSGASRPWPPKRVCRWRTPLGTSRSSGRRKSSKCGAKGLISSTGSPTSVCSGSARRLRELAEVRLAEIDRIVQTFLKDRNALDGVSVAELRRRLKDGGVVVLDVRPEGEYRAGHIAGARSVPLAELEARLHEIPKDQEVVAYCRGPYCVFADEAVALLRARGYRATAVRTGVPRLQGPRASGGGRRVV